MKGTYSFSYSLFPSPRLMTNNCMCTEELWNSPPGPPTWTQYDKELVFNDQSITVDEINHFIEGLTLEQYPEQLHMTNYPMKGSH